MCPAARGEGDRGPVDGPVRRRLQREGAEERLAFGLALGEGESEDERDHSTAPSA